MERRKNPTYMLDYNCIKFLWKETQETGNIGYMWRPGLLGYRNGKEAFASVVLYLLLIESLSFPPHTMLCSYAMFIP